MVKENKSDIIKLKIQGLTYQKIGDIFGVSRQRIEQIVSGRKSIYHKYIKILKRDNYTCQWKNICDDKLLKNLNIHHIDLDPGNNDENNLITICKYCHIAYHKSLNKYPYCIKCGKNEFLGNRRGGKNYICNH